MGMGYSLPHCGMIGAALPKEWGQSEFGVSSMREAPCFPLDGDGAWVQCSAGPFHPLSPVVCPAHSGRARAHRLSPRQKGWRWLWCAARVSGLIPGKWP